MSNISVIYKKFFVGLKRATYGQMIDEIADLLQQARNILNDIQIRDQEI